MLEEYERRQRQHKWLETHIWHAKRMFMNNLWGYKLVSYSIERCLCFTSMLVVASELVMVTVVMMVD